MRVALTQRVLHEDAEDLDCLDQAWTRVLESWGHVPVPVPGNLQRPERLFDVVKPEVLILTGGDDADPKGKASDAPEIERIERRLVAWCEINQIPVIGICRGMQLLVSRHGGHIRDLAGHVARRHLISVLETPFTGGGLKEVNSFHRHGIEWAEVQSPLIPFAWDVDGNVEAFYRSDGDDVLLEVGLMWHPERDEVAEWDSLVLNALLRHLESQKRAGHTFLL